MAGQQRQEGPTKAPGTPEAPRHHRSLQGDWDGQTLARGEVQRLVDIGATVVTPAGEASHLGFVVVVLTDPEGGEFCVVGRPEFQVANSSSTDS